LEPIFIVTLPEGVPETLTDFEVPVNVGVLGEILPVGVYLIFVPLTKKLLFPPSFSHPSEVQTYS
jgi:hypothetical protein